MPFIGDVDQVKLMWHQIQSYVGIRQVKKVWNPLKMFHNARQWEDKHSLPNRDYLYRNLDWYRRRRKRNTHVTKLKEKNKKLCKKIKKIHKKMVKLQLKNKEGMF